MGASSLVLSCAFILLGKRRLAKNSIETTKRLVRIQDFLSQKVADARYESRGEFGVLISGERKRTEGSLASIEQKITAMESKLSTLPDWVENTHQTECELRRVSEEIANIRRELQGKHGALNAEACKQDRNNFADVGQRVPGMEPSELPASIENIPPQARLIDMSPVSSEISTISCDSRDENEITDDASENAHEHFVPDSENEAEGQGRHSPEVAVNPLRRGGRRIGSAHESADYEKKDSIEIECVKRGSRWDVIAKIPDEIMYRNPEITENGVRVVLQDKGEFLISRLRGRIRCRWQEDGELQSLEKAYGSEGFILFKILSQDTRAKIASMYSSGEYLTVVPSNYLREDIFSGKELASPESCSIEGAQVHFFDTATQCGIAFRLPNGSVIKATPGGNLFTLLGDTCEHIRGRYGERVFFRRPPVIDAKDPSNWDLVDSVIIRSNVERGKRVKLYGDKNGAISIPEGMEKDGGHYSILLYDKNNELIESHPFAFHKNLFRVDVQGYDPFTPTHEGRKFSVDMYHAEGYGPILEENQSASEISSIKNTGESTIIHFSGHADREKFSWRLHPGCQDAIAFQTLFPFVWWSMGGDPAETVLGDALFEIGPEALRPFNGKHLFVKAPPSVKAINARFCAAGLNAQKLRRTGNGLWSIGLDDVGSAIFLNLSHYGSDRIPLVLSVVESTPDAAHKIHIADFVSRRKCRFCEETLDSYEIRRHLEEKHKSKILELMFRELSYKELADADETLPREIYKCGYCSFYHPVMHEEFLHSPTNVICEHIKRNHKGATPRFTPVTSISEIREKVRSDVRETWRCNVCGEDFTDRDVLLEHAMKCHFDRLGPDGGNNR